jgi:hypothetical protein
LVLVFYASKFKGADLFLGRDKRERPILHPGVAEEFEQKLTPNRSYSSTLGGNMSHPFQHAGRLPRSIKNGVSTGKQIILKERKPETPQVQLPELPQHIDERHIRETALAVEIGHFSKGEGAKKVREYHGTMYSRRKRRKRSWLKSPNTT